MADVTLGNITSLTFNSLAPEINLGAWSIVKLPIDNYKSALVQVTIDWNLSPYGITRPQWVNTTPSLQQHDKQASAL